MSIFVIICWPLSQDINESYTAWGITWSELTSDNGHCYHSGIIPPSLLSILWNEQVFCCHYFTTFSKYIYIKSQEYFWKPRASNKNGTVQSPWLFSLDFGEHSEVPTMGAEHICVCKDVWVAEIFKMCAVLSRHVMLFSTSPWFSKAVVLQTC